MMAKAVITRILLKNRPKQEKVGYEDEPDEPSFARSFVQFSGHTSRLESLTKNFKVADEDVPVTRKLFERKPLNILMDDSDDNDVIIRAAHKSFGFFCLKTKSKKIPCATENISKKTITKSFVYAVYLNDIGCIEYSNKKYKSAKETFAKVLIILDNPDKNSERTGLNAANIQRMLFTARNNYACALFREGEREKALSDFRELYQEEIKAGQIKLRQESESKLLSLCFTQYSSEKLNFKVILTINYSHASVSCEDYDQTVRDLNKGLEVCHHWFARSENHATKRLFSVALARILAAQRNYKKAFAILDSQVIDSIIIQKDIAESPLAVFSVREACFLLAQRGERDKVRHFKEVALKSLKETYDEDTQRALAWMLQEKNCALRISNPPALSDLAESMVKREEMEDSASKMGGLGEFCQYFCPQTLSKPASPSNASAVPETLPIRLRLAHFGNLESKRHMSVIRRRNLMLIDGHSDFLVLQGSEVQGLESLKIIFQHFVTPVPEIQSIKVVTKAEEILSEIHPLLSREAWLRRSTEDKWLIIAAIFLLLEELLAIDTILTSLYECICLLYNLAKERSEDSSDVELYKAYFGKLSYFISFDKLHMLHGEIPLTIVVLCGKSNIKNGDDDVTSTDKPLFRKITFHEPCKDQRGDADRPSRFGYMVILRSLDLLDINDLRRVKETIVETIKILENPSINLGESVFIQVVPDINPVKLPQQSLFLRSINSCFVENDKLVVSGPIKKPSVQDLYLQQFQKPLAFKNESGLDVFMALFQYTFSNLEVVDVLQKNRKEMVCLLKDPPFTLLTLHTKANTVYLILQDARDNCSSDGTPSNNATQLIDDIVDDCFVKLGISINDPQDTWRRLSHEQINEGPAFFPEKDTLEKAFKTNARLTAEVEYLKEKTQKLFTRTRKLLGQLSEMEDRAFLLQDHFVQTISSDKDRAKTAEKWFAKKKRGVDHQEGPGSGDSELEELVDSLANDELAGFLTEIQKEKIDGKSFDQEVHKVCVEGKNLSEYKTRDQEKKLCFDLDFESAGHPKRFDKKRIIQERTVGKFFEQELYDEEKSSSDRPSWHFPSPESTQDFSALNIAAEKTESSVFTEEFTQTDSLSLVQEYRDVDVQTDPVQLTNDENLEKGIADFRRDCAERQLRKSRLSQDVVALKNRPSQSIPDSCQDSFFTETSGFYSEGAPPYSITSSSLPAPMQSDGSIVSQAPSHDTEGVSSEESSRDSIVTETSGFYSGGTPRDSMTSGSLQSSIISTASSYGTDSMPSEGTTQDSIISGSSEQLPSQCSIVSQASSHGKEDVFSKGTLQDSITLPEQFPSKYSVVIEVSNHSTEGISSEETPQESATSRSLPEQLRFNSPIASEAASQRTKGIPSKETTRDCILNCTMSKHVTEMTEAGASGEASSEQLTSLTAQHVSADIADARERELRIAREREREERSKKEKEDIRRRLETSRRAKEKKTPSSPQPARLPVQESISEWPCSHYKRRCAIKFPCCEDFYFCHRCHNNSDKCEKDDKKALHGTHLRCLVCNMEQEITENSHHCINCNTQLAEYFCGICKHFTGNEKTPYHCGPCGICRIHQDRSFHCEVCNVCLDERLRNNHICRRDSGHDECCICLEDAFGGCQILPCSHKVHRDCAIAMLQNGVRKCPVCRHPLNQALQR